MEHEGMVHALEETKRLLRPAGCLIDIHPIREVPSLEVHAADRVVFDEPWSGYDYDDDLSHADEAVATALGRRLFVLDGRHEFEFVTSASSVAELRDYFALYGAYDEELVDDDVQARVDALYERADQIMASSGDARVVYRERVRMSRLEPVD
jgi:hypothetical protein